MNQPFPFPFISSQVPQGKMSRAGHGLPELLPVHPVEGPVELTHGHRQLFRQDSMGPHAGQDQAAAGSPFNGPAVS